MFSCFQSEFMLICISMNLFNLQIYLFHIKIATYFSYAVRPLALKRLVVKDFLPVTPSLL